MRLLTILVAVVAGPIGQIAAILAAIFGPRPLQLAACGFGLFTAFVLLTNRDLEGWFIGAIIYGAGWGIALGVIL